MLYCLIYGTEEAKNTGKTIVDCRVFLFFNCPKSQDLFLINIKKRMRNY